VELRRLIERLDSAGTKIVGRGARGAAAIARVRKGDGGVRAATGDVNRTRLRELGFELGARAGAGVSDEGAWFATAPDGAPVVLKWFPDETVAERYAVLLPGLDELRSRGVSVPEYPHVLAVDGWTLSAQQVLPGASVRNPSRAMVEQVVGCVAGMAGVACPLPVPDLRPWGASVVHTLTVGVDGWAMHEPLRTGGRRSAAVLDRVEAVGADADPAWFPTDGLVHLDLHTDNILTGGDGTLTRIIDWEGACAGDPASISSGFSYDLDGHDQPVWDVVEPPASSGACFERTSPTTRCGARPGRSTTTPMTCPASSTVPSASSIHTRPRRRRPWPNAPGRVVIFR
jgi:hypothetical protein